jgi:hypothetical protein
MALVKVTCCNCNGSGHITAEGGDPMFIFFKTKTCNECEGVGSHLVHTGQIGSRTEPIISDNTWDKAWLRVDDDIPAELSFP